MPISGPVAELIGKGADEEQIDFVEALIRTFQERRRFAPVAAPISDDGGQAA